MPPIIIGLGIALLAGPIGISVLGSLAIANAMIGIGLSITLSGIGSMLTKHPSTTNTQSSVDLGSSTVTVRAAVSPRITQYGQDRRGGVVTFIDTTGTNNEFLHLVITMTGHGITSFDDMFFDGVLVPLD